MKAPTGCALWRDPSLVDSPISERFEVVATYVGDDHLWRYLLECRECGQRYVFQYHEVVGWADSDTPQDTVYVPVETDDQVDMLVQTSPDGLLAFSPRLHRTFLKTGQSRVYWAGKPAGEAALDAALAREGRASNGGRGREAGACG